VRALKFATYLPEFGCEPVVVAPSNGSYYEDRTLSFAGERIFTRNFQLSRFLSRTPRRRNNTERQPHNSTATGIKDIVRRWLYRPDGQVGWYPFALTAARRAFRRTNFDAILSSSPPITAHLVGRTLHRETGCAWVAEFRDLWTAWRSPSERRQQFDEAIERSILTEATEVVTVSPGCAAFLRSRGAPRVSVITIAFDPSD